jgi:outer membrane receptor protein involved in Fe transport
MIPYVATCRRGHTICVRAPLVSACILLAAASTSALADQGTPPPTDTSDEQRPRLQEVLVTGSRVARDTFNTPNPVTVVGSDEMEKLGLSNVGDVMAQLPQNSAFVTAGNVGLGNFNIGAQLANLRGLNPFFGTRTLTLVDGRRFVPSTNGGAVDLNLIPSNMVARIETVTGGASAAYGTDAVAGVVNVILNTDLEGFKGQIDPGSTAHGDGSSLHGSAAFGHGFASGRGHFLIGGEYQHDGGIGDCATVRDWCAQNQAVFTNPGFNTRDANNVVVGNGLPNFIIGPNGQVPNSSVAGMFPGAQPPSGAALANMQFNAAGTALTPYNPGAFNNSPLNFAFLGPVQGGDSNLSPYNIVTIRPPLTHYEGMAHTSWDFTDSLQGFVELSYGKRTASNRQFSLGPTLAAIQKDNAFLPAAVASQIGNLGPGVPGFAFFNSDVSGYLRQTNNTSNETRRGVVGLKGDLPAQTWHWDAYFEYGKNEQSQRLANLSVNGTGGKYNFLAWALDAVRDPASGNIVCRATLPGPAFNPLAAGCVPLNLFGTSNADPRALAYAYRTLPEDFEYQQSAAAANIRGDLFEGWGAGPIGVAAGLEYRHDQGDVTHQMATTPWYNDFALSYGLDFKGTIKVVEGYGEVNVPVLRNLPAAKNLEFDGAVRRTRNTSSDGITGESKDTNITTWKISGIYDPLDWLRVRATRSSDIRAAGFRELFSKTVLTNGGPFGSVNNPWAGGVNQPTQIQGGGSFDLEPEEAKTTTVGLVFQPRGALEGVRFSADWYEVKISQAITTPTANNLAANCHDFDLFCDRINHGVDPDTIGGVITYIDTSALNLNEFLTHGVDFEAGYALPIASTSGNLNVRLVASYLYDFKIGGVQWAGQTGPTAAFGDFNTSPYWQGTAYASYAQGPFTGTVQLRYIGWGKYNATYKGPEDPGYDPKLQNSISDNRVASATYVNLAGSYELPEFGKGMNVELFASINNLFDRDPPVAPGGNGYPTNPVYFDTYGMTWRAGVRVAF